jgi:hypothetical protein
MTVTLTLPPETEALLEQRAAQAGQTVEGYLLQLIEEAVAAGSPATVLAAVAAGPQVPAAWVDELEQIIAEGQRPPVRENPLGENDDAEERP